MFSSEEGEHNVKNFLLCSSAHPACSPLLQGFLHEEELYKVALTCHFLRCDLSLSGLSGSLSLELSLWLSVASFLTLQICLVLGFVFDLLSVLLPTVAAFLSLPPQVGMLFNVPPARSFFEGEERFSRHVCCRRCQLEDRQSGTGSVAVTATCATTPLFQSTLKTTHTFLLLLLFGLVLSFSSPLGGGAVPLSFWSVMPSSPPPEGWWCFSLSEDKPDLIQLSNTHCTTSAPRTPPHQRNGTQTCRSRKRATGGCCASTCIVGRSSRYIQIVASHRI